MTQPPAPSQEGEIVAGHSDGWFLRFSLFLCPGGRLPELKAENERMKKAFTEAVKEKAEERTKALVAEKQKTETEQSFGAESLSWH